MLDRCKSPFLTRNRLFVGIEDVAPLISGSRIVRFAELRTDDEEIAFVGYACPLLTIAISVSFNSVHHDYNRTVHFPVLWSMKKYSYRFVGISSCISPFEIATAYGD